MPGVRPSSWGAGRNSAPHGGETMSCSEVAVHSGARVVLVHARRADYQVVFIAHGDRPGMTGQVSGPARVGDSNRPGMVGGIACAVAPEQLVLGMRPSAADPRGHD